MNLQVFENENLGSIRVLGNNENPLFCLRDICEVLEISNTSDVKNAIKREFGDGVDLIYPITASKETIESDSDNGVDLIYPIKDSLGREQQATFITEPQLYFVLMRSDKPKAKPFRQWVISDVLPSIRKSGGYCNKDEMYVFFLREKLRLLKEANDDKESMLNLFQDVLDYWKNHLDKKDSQ
ncbi:hypothetical protein CCZ01_09545 [Helicobacter monodelphidis]|uniref:BRO-N domain-containing protein n=1 Tax=Helicobacter sp. 15-1451 TaxID=2004995 RepID=UPI000DCB7263|nr:BRO family protein [Helicobacter sp. 15-1451]RAX56433.1 hypothetical protein CCZ01_09545 [Helicobacter sp. 15-1451]